MKRLLLTCAAATAIMLSACIDVDLARSAHSVDGARVTLTSGSSEGAGNALDDQDDAGDAGGSNTSSHDDVRARS